MPEDNEQQCQKADSRQKQLDACFGSIPDFPDASLARHQEREVLHRNYREEIRKKSIRINLMAVGLAAFITLVFASVIGYCFIVGKTTQEIVAIGTFMFWIGIIGYAVGFTLSYFLRSQVRMDVGLDLSIQMVERTIALQEEFNEERERFRAVVDKVGALVEDIRSIVKDVKESNFSERAKRMEDAFDDIRKGLLGDFRGLEAKGHKFE